MAATCWARPKGPSSPAAVSAWGCRAGCASASACSWAGSSSPRRCAGMGLPNGKLIDVRVGREVLEDFLPLFLVGHQVRALTPVPPFHAALGFQKQGIILLPVEPPPPPAEVAQLLLL